MTVGPIKVKRFRTLPDSGGETLYFKLDIGRLGRFLDPRQVPEFEGDVAWFEVDYTLDGPIRFIRRIEPPRGWR